MTSNLKCPFCGKQMKIGMLDPDDSMGTVWMSIMPCDCVCSYGASKAVWQALTQAKQDLEIARNALKELRGDRCLPAQTPWEIIAEKALEQIDHKE